MKDINYKFKKVISKLDMDSVFAIFDVDRTIINTTSWYHACIMDDLIISKSNVSLFKKMNEECFGHSKTLSNDEFRKKTLELITPKNTEEFFDKIQEFKNINELLKSQDYISLLNFYVAGKYVARHNIIAYETAIQYILMLHKYYGRDFKLIFLTAGYEPFIRGVVDEIVKIKRLDKINYTVIGSELEINQGIAKEVFHMSQSNKKLVVKKIINSGGKIKFLADDAKDDMELFQLVNNNGGTALLIKHQPNMTENVSWNEFWESISEEKIKEQLMNKEKSIKIVQKEIENNNFLKQLSKITNEIGIACISTTSFNKALIELTNKIKNNENKEKLLKNIEKLVFKKDKKTYLRGSLFYNWLPQYIFINNKPLNLRWKDLFNTTISALCIIQEEKILNKELIFEEKVIIYSLLDHLQEAILYKLNLIECNNLDQKRWSEKENELVIELAQEISDLLFVFYNNSIKTDILLKEILNKIINQEVIQKIPEYIPIYKTMRELDDNITIFKFVEKIAEDLKNKDIKLDYILSFPYGGITLGFALNSYLKVFQKKKILPQTLNCHYSSKGTIRKGKIEKSEQFSAFKYIPKVYDRCIENFKNGNFNVLLLDNNVTTFKTLDLTKQYLKQLGNNVYSAVASVNYDNIVNYLFDKKCEKLISNWRTVLDFSPVQKYITAFNTWNTSEKTERLKDIYYNDRQVIQYNNKPIIDINRNNQYIFKACRIQNVCDLNTAIRNGVNMIGIHAVYPDRIEFIKNELKYKPDIADLNENIDLPIDIFQLEAIRKMQKYVPEGVQKVLLFEQKANIKTILQTCNTYDISPSDVYIQLQHRTDNKQIIDIKTHVSKKIIATVGIFQIDFKEYFWKIHECLEPNTDYILIDLSKHQPDLISGLEKSENKIDMTEILNGRLKLISGNKVPIIIADDTTTLQMHEYLKIIKKYNIKIKGIDMQNALELDTFQQRYQIIEHNGSTYQIKIRKSPTKMLEWKNFFNNINKDIFKR